MLHSASLSRHVVRGGAAAASREASRALSASLIPSARIERSGSCNVYGQQRRNISSTSAIMSTITVDNINPAIKTMEYAVRGPLVIRATELEKELQKGAKKPFTEVIKANIGDAHAMGAKPITFLRQVLALVTHPPLLESAEFPADAKSHAKVILDGCKGSSVGSYSDSTGIEVIRQHVAQYIEKRDGGIKSDANRIILSAGASESIRAVLKLLVGEKSGVNQPGVMIPIPQYPLYSASLAEYSIAQVGYYLNEDKSWALDMSELERSIGEARKTCKPRAIVIINPGNPTGSVLSEQNIRDVIKFAHREKLFVIADEVYQDNVYADGCKFHSFKKVMFEMGAPYDQMELASFMSCSKGYMGECGIRGGYGELVNMDAGVMAMLNKSISAKLCPTVIGQACMDVVVNPPQPGEESYDDYIAQRNANLASLAERAKLVADTFNSIEGFTCNTVQGAMYAFPQLHLPKKAIEAAKKAGQPADVFYAFQLLESTGICIIPGSGFGQKPGTYHFRTTILPQKAMLNSMLDRLKKFHMDFLKQHAD
jgi:alanine transaminase